MENKRLLVIDDDPFILESIKKQLKDEKFDITLLNSPEEAIVTAGNADFDLVLCDVKMEPLSGIDVLKVLKKQRPEIPVIMLSGYVDDQLIEKAQNLGCTRFLIKPLRKKELINVINEILGLIF
jgi:CheY-like chemotaxis protein